MVAAQRAVLGLAVYDALAGRWDHPRLSPDALSSRAPGLLRDGIDGGYRYEDAHTDDARLVLRVLREAQNDSHGVTEKARLWRDLRVSVANSYTPA